jgi:hypothetical protein
VDAVAENCGSQVNGQLRLFQMLFYFLWVGLVLTEGQMFCTSVVIIIDFWVYCRPSDECAPMLLYPTPARNVAFPAQGKGQ